MPAAQSTAAINTMSMTRLTALRVNPSGDGVVPRSVQLTEVACDTPAPMPGEPDLDELLLRLEREEQEVSTRRAKIHERLASFPNSVLEGQERQLSERRRQLHEEIDKVRSRIRELG